MKKVLRYAFVAAFVAVASYGIYINQNVNGISALALANVEALAEDENEMCLNGCVDDGKGCLCHYWFPTFKEYGE